MTEWILLAAAVLLVAANAIFVAAEFSLVTVDRSTVDQRADAGDTRAAGLRQGLRSLSTQLSGAQLGAWVRNTPPGVLGRIGWSRDHDVCQTITSKTVCSPKMRSSGWRSIPLR